MMTFCSSYGYLLIFFLSKMLVFFEPLGLPAKTSSAFTKDLSVILRRHRIMKTPLGHLTIISGLFWRLLGHIIITIWSTKGDRLAVLSVDLLMKTYFSSSKYLLFFFRRFLVFVESLTFLFTHLTYYEDLYLN